MVVADIAVTYRYATPSSLDSSDAGLGLGLTSTGADTLLDAFVERADVLAGALLRVGEVAATRFYVHPSSAAAALRAIRAADPIITVGDGAVRFESLSTDCGVAARLDVHDAALDAAVRQPGTTNVDLGPALRQLLTRVRRRDPMRLVVSPTGLGVVTLDGHVEERVVRLPERWVRSLAELQALASRMTLAADLGPAQAQEFLRGLPARTGREPFWVQRVDAGIRLAASPGAGRIAVGSPERLRVLAPVLRHATGLRVYGSEVGGPAASWWEVLLPGARLGLAISPDVSRGFSGEGALLDELALDDSGVDLARRGLVGYDLAEQRYFERGLPFGREVLDAAPRVDRARSLVGAGKVRLDGGLVLVAGTDLQHVVRLGPDAETCTCSWYLKHRGDRGPCAHVLAARMFLEERR